MACAVPEGYERVFVGVVVSTDLVETPTGWQPASGSIGKNRKCYVVARKHNGVQHRLMPTGSR
jgi:hypothetical protein